MMPLPLPLLLALALPLLTLGTLIIAVNLYTSLLRYPLHRLRGDTRDNFRFVSGVPLVGSLLYTLLFKRRPQRDAQSPD